MKTPLRSLFLQAAALTAVLGCLSLPLHGQENRVFAVQTRIEAGLVEGVYDVKTGIQTYLGVPFAQPPVGELRWKAPQPVLPWVGVKETKRFGPSAVQAPVFNDIIFRSSGMSEDCLYLNVWTPAKRNTTGLPVLVYFYGGGFVAGDGSEPRYDGASMAARGIVTVTVNYRLAIFGSLALPELSAEAPYKASGNYGFLDQSAALKWVHDNIASFGGDPKKITIAGESAGSMSVSVQMASPLSRGYIAGAIGESGSAISRTIATVTLAEAEKQGAEFARKAGNFTLKQLRAMSTREIFEIYQESKRWGFPPALDGYLLPKPLTEIYSAGEQAQVPLLVGWNSAEIPGFAFVQAPVYSEETYVKKVKEAYPRDFETVLKLYPAGSPQEIERSATALAADRFIAYSTWKWFDLHRKHTAQPTYRYLYSKIPPQVPPPKSVKKGPAPFVMPPPIGAPHACEIEYCLGNLDLLKDTPWTADDYIVSETMQAYFANFIKTGNPNAAGLPDWPAALAQDPAPPVMQIDVLSKAAPSTVEARYKFLDQVSANQ